MSLLLCLYLSLQLALVVVEGPSRQLGASAPYAPDILQVAVWSLLLLLFATAEHRLNAHTKALDAHRGAPIAVQRGETNVPVAIHVRMNRSRLEKDNLRSGKRIGVVEAKSQTMLLRSIYAAVRHLHRHHPVVQRHRLY